MQNKPIAMEYIIAEALILLFSVPDTKNKVAKDVMNAVINIDVGPPEILIITTTRIQPSEAPIKSAEYSLFTLLLKRVRSRLIQIPLKTKGTAITIYVNAVTENPIIDVPCINGTKR